MLAQARLPVRCMGTTHADHFRGDVPVMREMTEPEVSALGASAILPTGSH